MNHTIQLEIGAAYSRVRCAARPAARYAARLDARAQERSKSSKADAAAIGGHHMSQRQP